MIEAVTPETSELTIVPLGIVVPVVVYWPLVAVVAIWLAFEAKVEQIVS
jgi:hypothetical protein